MRAIIITDAEGRSLLDQLKLEKMVNDSSGCRKPTPEESDMHRRFHYVVCRWLQEMGCDVVRRV